MVWKPYLADGKILVEMVQADAFFPLEAGPDGKITSAVFLEQVRQREKWFTRMEEHRMTQEGVLVTNRAFVSNGAERLAQQIPLESLRQWAGLERQALQQGWTSPLFV